MSIIAPDVQVTNHCPHFEGENRLACSILCRFAGGFRSRWRFVSCWLSRQIRILMKHVFLSTLPSEFDSLISQHVEISFFVPLIMGHGGNTGSQTTCAVIRYVTRSCQMSVLSFASAYCIGLLGLLLWSRFLSRMWFQLLLKSQQLGVRWVRMSRHVKFH